MPCMDQDGWDRMLEEQQDPVYKEKERIKKIHEESALLLDMRNKYNNTNYFDAERKAIEQILFSGPLVVFLCRTKPPEEVPVDNPDMKFWYRMHERRDKGDKGLSFEEFLVCKRIIKEYVVT